MWLAREIVPAPKKFLGLQTARRTELSTPVTSAFGFSGQNGLLSEPFSAYSTRENAGIAQLVEQLICNQQVVGSNPSAGSSAMPANFK